VHVSPRPVSHFSHIAKSRAVERVLGIAASAPSVGRSRWACAPGRMRGRHTGFGDVL
jgi:hypothetical protein